MSLIMHLPLNGNLDNYGVNKSVFTNNNCTIDNTGKTGKCYSFNGSSSTITSPYLMGLSGDVEFTISFWFYWNSSSWNGDYPAIIYNNSFASGRGISVIMHGGKVDVDFIDYRYEMNDVLNVKQWYHVIVTKNKGPINSTTNIYINGNKVAGTGNTSKVPNIIDGSIILGRLNDSSSRYFSGKLNDVRIYDNVLSLKEIKELYKTCVVHYSFNSEYAEYVNNLLPNMGISTGSVSTAGWYNNQSATITNDVMSGGISCIKCKSEQSSSTPGMYCNLSGLKQNTDYTLSAIIESNVSVGFSAYDLSKSGDYTLYPTAKKNYLVFNTGTNTSTRFFFFMTGPTTSSYLKVYNIQLEEKNRASYFSNGISDTLYDESGFKYNSILNAVSPVYDSSLSCIKFNGSNYIDLPESLLNGLNDGLSVSMWYKFDSYPTAYSTLFSISQKAGASWNQEYFTIQRFGNNAFLCLNIADGSSYIAGGCQLSVARNLNQWYHIVAVYDKINMKAKLYLNGGEESAEYSLSFTPTFNDSTPKYIRLGISCTSYGMNGCIKNLKLYTTTLNVDDAKELYQTSQCIDKNYNLYSNNFIELQEEPEELVINGHGQYKNLIGYTGGNTVITNDNYNGSVSVIEMKNYSADLLTTPFIPFNKDCKYKLSFDIKGVTLSEYTYCDVRCYDNNYYELMPPNVTRHGGNTTLASALNNGDTIVYLASVSGWATDQTYRYVGICDNPAWGYNRNSYNQKYNSSTVNTLNNTVTLQSPWTGGSVSSGTPVACFTDGGTFVYPYYWSPSSMPTTWTHYELDINSSILRPTTAFIRLGFLVQPNTIRVANLSLKNISQVQNISSIPEIRNISFNKKGIVNSNGFNEVGMNIRYIKDQINGSTANSANHWVEIQAIDENGINMALAKQVTGADSTNGAGIYSTNKILVDGSPATSPYVSGASPVIDLKGVFNIVKLKVWHYWGDGRTYHNNITQVSEDGVNWITVFNSDIDGEYVETSSGHEILLIPKKVSIGKDGQVWCNELKEI